MIGDYTAITTESMNVFITGTNSGIGNALARAYLEKGATVYGLSRKFNGRMDKYADYHHLSHDLRDVVHLKERLKSFLEGVDTLDQVILNAGALPPINDMQDTGMEEILNVMMVNVWSNKVLLDTLIRCVGRIHQVVAISSGAAVSGSRGWNVYAISKAALNMMIKLYAKERPETHFTALAPGVVDTRMQDYIYNLEDDGRFEIVSRLKRMRDRREMSDPGQNALELIEAMGTVLQHESGQFIDVRDLH